MADEKRITFSVSDEFIEALDILEDLKKGTKSRFVCEAIIEKYHREKNPEPIEQQVQMALLKIIQSSNMQGMMMNQWIQGYQSMQQQPMQQPMYPQEYHGYSPLQHANQPSTPASHFFKQDVPPVEEEKPSLSEEKEEVQELQEVEQQIQEQPSTDHLVEQETETNETDENVGVEHLKRLITETEEEKPEEAFEDTPKNSSKEKPKKKRKVVKAGGAFTEILLSQNENLSE